MIKGELDFKEFEEFQKELEKEIGKTETDRFFEDCCKELAARLLSKVIKRTPVGVYPKESGKVGGTLRRGWTGGKKSAGTTYARSLPVKREGGDYVIEIKNPVDYASYVEYGHRTRSGGWVEGQFFLTISEDELEKVTPKVLERKLMKRLKELLDD